MVSIQEDIDRKEPVEKEFLMFLVKKQILNNPQEFYSRRFLRLEVPPA